MNLSDIALRPYTIAGLEQDILRYGGRIRHWDTDLPRFMLLYPGFRLSTLWRIGHQWRLEGKHYRSALMTRAIRSQFNSDVGVEARIGPRVHIPHPIGIVIGGEAAIGCGCTIGPRVTIGGNLGRTSEGRTMPRIGDRVMILTGAVIAGPILVADGAVVGANTVVTKSVLAGATTAVRPRLSPDLQLPAD